MRIVLLVLGTGLGSLLMVASSRAEPPEIRFPSDPWIIDAQRDLGAKGDGISDDTDALQKGLDLSSGFQQKTTKVLYLPNGTYKISRTLFIKNRQGPWLYGQSRDGAIIKLADGVKDVTCVLRTHPNEKGPTSADWFKRNIRNLTIDVGNNPTTDGIRWHSTNTGIIQNVRVRGQGAIGIHTGFVDQSGPNLIQDTIVEGFETGILSQWAWSQTLSRVTIRNAKQVGLKVVANVVAAEDLVIENVPQPVVCDLPNDWHWWGGVLTIVGGKITGKNASGPAISNRSVLYARDVTTEGYKLALESNSPGGNVTEATIKEYSSHPARKAFTASERSLGLPSKREPALNWETDPEKWLCINDFGAVAGDNQDDTAAIQKAIDAAAAAGKTTLYFRGCGGGDPNWYTLDGEVRVHGSVRHILSLGFGRVLGGKTGRFVVTDQSAPVVKFQNLDSFGGPPATLENRSQKNTLVAESCGVSILGTGQGDIFLTDCPAGIELKSSGQNVWCRQLNPEGESDVGLVRNAGANLWILGMKCEGGGVRIRTTDQGRTEVLGAFIYGPGLKDGDRRPIFIVHDAALTFTGLREITFGKNPYQIKVREIRNGETRDVGTRPGEHFWIGWSLYSGWQEK